MRIERNRRIGMGTSGLGNGIIIELNGLRSLCDWYYACIQAMYSGWCEQDHVKWE